MELKGRGDEQICGEEKQMKRFPPVKEVFNDTVEGD